LSIEKGKVVAFQASGFSQSLTSRHVINYL